MCSIYQQGCSRTSAISVSASYAREQFQEELEELVDARDHEQEYHDYAQNDARGLDNLGKGGPCYPFEFGKGLLELFAHSYKNVGLFGFIFVFHINSFNTAKKLKLLGFLVFGVLFAERAVFGDSDPVGIVALILKTVVIPVLALCALKGYLGSH